MRRVERTAHQADAAGDETGMKFGAGKSKGQGRPQLARAAIQRQIRGALIAQTATTAGAISKAGVNYDVNGFAAFAFRPNATSPTSGPASGPMAAGLSARRAVVWLEPMPPRQQVSIRMSGLSYLASARAWRSAAFTLAAQPVVFSLIRADLPRRPRR